MNLKINFYVIIPVVLLVAIVFFVLLPPDPSTIDSDNDGVMDDKDVFPNNGLESIDTDGDGVGDNSDKFPLDPSASIDIDDDGYPDEWNEGKSQSDSTSDPPLIIDEFPDNPYEYHDSDGDGVGDNSDMFPDDASEWRDDDYDGVGNNKDMNPNVDLGFTLYLDSFTIERMVDFIPRAQVYFVIKINDEIHSILDNDAGYWRVWLLKEQSIDQTINYEIPDDTSDEKTKIELIMYDKDVFFQDDIIDINANDAESSLIITYDHKQNTVNINNKTTGPVGYVSFIVTLPDYVEADDEFRKMSYGWSYKGIWHSISVNVSVNTYNWYGQRDVNRSPQQIGTTEMRKFVTEDASIIKEITALLLDIADRYQYNDTETINLILSFVQYTVDYREDMASKNVEEYWKFPFETLFEGTGDCEDSSTLFQSIIKNTDYDVVMLFYIIDDEIGHLSSGVSLDQTIPGYSVSYKNKEYYYCETTSPSFYIGDKPDDVPDTPEKIISLE